MNKEIKTDNFVISENSPAYIIAEIGINHNGQYELAKQLIIESAKAGANAVKFQKRDANSIMIKENCRFLMSYLTSIGYYLTNYRTSF